MKNTIKQKHISILLIISFFIVMFSTLGAKLEYANAAGQTTIKMLEITENGTSDLTGLSNSAFKLDLTTYSMKQFVASRDYLDGKYDAVYIGKGTYSTAIPAGVLNTSTKQNDITNLKATELKHYFVNKGLPLIVYGDTTTGALKQSTDGKLHKFITSVQNKSNVSFVNSSEISNATTFANKTSLLTKATVRPQLTIVSKPSEYASTNKIYTRGETLTYSYNITNSNNLGNLEVNLYIGIDSAVPFTTKQLVASTTVTANNGTISYSLPRGYSGPRYWRLELVDLSSGLKDVHAGSFRFKDETKVINVLQYRPNNSGDDAGLDKDHNFDSSYLVKSGDYEIKFTATTVNSFNGGGGSYGYEKFQAYDMLIFGFAHEYKEYAFIEVQAAREALLSYINSGKSVMFTHDTFNPYSREGYRSEYWNNFRAIAAMIDPANNVGNINNSYTTSTKRANSGLLTDFPFVLPNDIEVMSTHGQYYTLDLEDPDVIPWYNLSGGGRTVGDSWNHYYAYSKGNITFTNSGHSGQTTTGYTEGERQLFLNTMYRAFTMANHGPVITVFSPEEYDSVKDNFIPTFNEIPVHYQVDDLDLGDTNLTTSVNFIYNGQTYSKIPARSIISGDTINMSFENPLPNGGDLIVEIIATDSKGAQSKKQIKVKVKKVSSNLELSRSFSNNVVNNKVDTGSTVTMNYTITPKPIAGSGSSMSVTNIQFKETLPPNLEVSSLPTGFTKTGNVTTGYTISRNLSNIQYTKKGTDTLYTADPVTFSITAVPIKRGFYPLNSATLTFKDIGQSSNFTLPFPGSTLEAVTKLTSLSLSDRTILVGDSLKLFPTYTPGDLTDVPFTWSSDKPGIVTVDNTGTIRGIAEGTARITVTALDGSNLSATANITVVKPGLFINGPDEVAVGENITLTSRLMAADYEQVTSYSWSIDSGSSFLSISPTNQASTTATGINKGTSTVKLTVITNKGNTYTATATVRVVKRLTGLHLDGTTLFVGESATLTPQFTPTDASDRTVTWQTSNASIVSVTPAGVVTGVDSGEVTITIRSQDGSNLTASAIVRVIQPNPTFTGPDTVDLGLPLPLDAEMQSSVTDPIVAYSWSVNPSSTGGVIIQSQSGSSIDYRATKQGEIVVKVVVTTQLGRTYESAPKSITINPVALGLPDSIIVSVNDTKELFASLSSGPVYGKVNIKDFLIWNSDNPSTVSINSDGKITAIKEGSANITVQSRYDSTVSATTKIIVKRKFDDKGKY
ncbi:Uncharacterized conserved protein YjdB, contains Ig-like domain [Fontibacillus panacisegetis]|uniref:Uncharacterized conserved protein YjdB, contains Ig-like domain n=1 Tax=Fontibacillus panacisegetis TaxID=670482 RepID=A0A1G7JA08_9BACL|nr:DUF5057 domain-containing protein [Fontibacillus panacisegetis]SDF21713.1 Uncharacterized conserved protein YjdB, contains Ig-like domain [Fontibacillus panacisegetis]